MRFHIQILNKLKPELFFAVFASFFGIIILLITPPFQVPDEINHFYKAYQVSEGQFISIKQDKRTGGYLPASLLKITQPFLALPGQMHAKTNYATIAEQLKTPLEEDTKVFMDFPNTAVYSPVSYIPQAISIYVFRKFNLPPLYIFYGARLFTLLFWLFCIFYAIKIIPFYKWFFALIALLPMSMYINMSLSADVVTNATSLLLIAYLLKLAYSEEAFTSKNFMIITLLAFVLASAKIVYTPILLLFLLIPKEKFKSKTNYYIQLSILFMISLGTALVWANAMNSLYLPYSQYNEQYRDGATLIDCADMHEQMKFILSHGIYIVQVFANSMIQSFDMYYQGCIGTFGWLDTKLPIVFIHLSYLVLLLVALTDNKKEIKIKPKHKIIIFISMITVIGLILLSQHLTWDCVGGDIIANLQGRYFAPVFPLFFMLFYTVKINYSKTTVPLIIIFSFISLSFTTNTLYKRYYVAPVFKTVSIQCDAEKITNDNRFATDTSFIYFDNANTRSMEKARSGKYSAKLNPTNQFGYTYHLYDCGYGDILNVDVWRFGKDGNIIITGSNNDFYVGNSIAIEKDSAGWEHIQLKFTVPKDMNNKEVSIYLFNDGKDSSYFDDFSVTHCKLQ